MFGAEIIASLGTALGIAFVTYVSKSKGGENFSPKKFARTMAVGLGVGVIAYFTGFTITEQNFAEYAAQNTGVVAVADQMVKFIWRLFK